MTTTVDQLHRELDQNTFPLDRYEPIEKLGHGRSGRAILCLDQLMEQQVVVKTLGNIELDHLVEFQRDAKVLCRISHKSIAQVLDYGTTTGGAVYIVFEYHAGTSLSKYMDEYETLSPELMLKVFLPIAEALGVFHSNGILHRDIKPSNILVKNLEMQDTQIHLIDAGTGRVKRILMEPIVFEGRNVSGEVCYMAPEQAAAAETYDMRSEIFAFGCTVFESLTGRTPFTGNSSDTLTMLTRRSPPSLTQVTEGLSFPHRLEAFVAKCLAKSPEMRYQSMQEVHLALKDLSKLHLTVERTATRTKTDGKSQVPVNKESIKSTPSASEQGPLYKSVPPTRPGEEKKIDLILEDGSKLTIKGEVEPSEMKLVEADAQPASEQKQPNDDTKAGANNEGTKSNTKQKPQSQNSVSDSKAASATIIEVEPEPTPTAPDTADPTTGLVTARESLNNAWTRFADWWKNKPLQRNLASGGLLVLVICGCVMASYISFLTAPREEIVGVVFYNEPATENKNGHLELCIMKPTDFLIVPITIENPAINLPTAPSEQAAPFMLDPDSGFQTRDLFSGDTLMLTNMESSSARGLIPKDFHLGERYKVVVRNQFGRFSLEELQYGVQPPRDLEKCVMAIGKMLRQASHGERFTTNNDWASDKFQSEIFMFNTGKLNALSQLQSSDIKLETVGPSMCSFMIKSPYWLSDQSPFMRVTLDNNGEKWVVRKVTKCSEPEWERKLITP